MPEEDKNREENINDEGAEDLVFEDMDESENPAAVIRELRKRIKECTEEKQAHLTDLQRTKADFINLRKRDEKEKEEFIKFASADFILELIPVLDSFEHAIGDGKNSPELKRGLESISSQLLAILERNGVKRISPLGKEFDPSFHEAIAMVETNERDKDHKVLEVLQTGYIIGERTLRPAKVRVGKLKQN